MNDHTLPRFLTRSVAEQLRVMPAVVVTGARQTGKSTLAQKLAPGGRRYLTFDDLDVMEAARRDPEAIVGGTEPVTLDEVQREPDVLAAVKRAIDRTRRPGQFLITGSANLLLMQRVSETLAGRAGYLTLWPMTRRELAGGGGTGRWSDLFDTDDNGWLETLADETNASADWRPLARRGGFPVPALQLHSDKDRSIWHQGYVRTYLERDLQQLSNVAALPDFRRLMRATGLRLGQLVNQTELARDVALSQPTVHRWLNLLETAYLLVRLPAYAANRTKRLIKTPKIYWGDTALALHLAGVPEPSGAHLENVVLHDLMTWRDAHPGNAEIYYWRTANGEEVDFVVEFRNQLLPIEIKSTGRPNLRDAQHLRLFRSLHRNSRAGLVLHGGNTMSWLAPDVLAVPWWRVI